MPVERFNRHYDEKFREIKPHLYGLIDSHRSLRLSVSVGVRNLNLFRRYLHDFAMLPDDDRLPENFVQSNRV